VDGWLNGCGLGYNDDNSKRKIEINQWVIGLYICMMSELRKLQQF